PVHSARQISFHIFDSYSRQPRHRFTNLRLVFGDDHNRRVEFDQLRRPRSELPPESDVQRGGNRPPSRPAAGPPAPHRPPSAGAAAGAGNSAGRRAPPRLSSASFEK